VPYKKHAGVKFEIQITTVLSHAWSEIEHEWYDLEDAYPYAIKRRFSCLAALLELAEAEFLSLRNQKRNYERSVDIRVEADARDIALDSVSLSTFISVEPIVTDLDLKIAAILKADIAPTNNKTTELRSKMAKQAGFASLGELRLALNEYYATVAEYVRLCTPHWRPPRSIQSGVSIFQLSAMLLGAQGKDKLVEAMRASGLSAAAEWLPAQAAVAAEVMSKHKKR
jgi:putative GTP pyrophosphokinase